MNAQASSSPHVVVDYPHSQSTTRTLESDIMARRLLTRAMNMQDPLNDDDTFTVDITAMNYSVTVSELTKSLQFLDGSPDYESIKFIAVDSNGTCVHFKRLQCRS